MHFLVDWNRDNEFAKGELQVMILSTLDTGRQKRTPKKAPNLCLVGRTNCLKSTYFTKALHLALHAFSAV